MFVLCAGSQLILQFVIIQFRWAEPQQPHLGTEQTVGFRQQNHFTVWNIRCAIKDFSDVKLRARRRVASNNQFVITTELSYQHIVVNEIVFRDDVVRQLLSFFKISNLGKQPPDSRLIEIIPLIEEHINLRASTAKME